ncbi:MAG: shikimate kinase [Magnetococcales bacterium]|nr:shikimate kinase [Magnetococcales bacterium]MBF0117116.1 shikimate kinase [Magnetococcales bacterium]
MNIVLIGLRGCGKSSVSRLLAKMSKRSVLSTDLLFSYENGGQSIADYVAACQGDWRPFRAQEYQIICKAAALDHIIIDCGGGIVVDCNEHRQEIFSYRKVKMLRRNGRLFWLHGDLPRLAAKVQTDRSRPNLSSQLPLLTLMERRLPFYQQAAHHTILIDNKSRQEIAHEILALSMDG